MKTQIGKIWKNRAFQFTFSFVIFFAVTMPFRYWFSFSNTTEIRPAAALVPFFGMLFGFWGSLGCALSNFLADMLSGYGLGLSLASLPVQLLMGVLPYLLWRHIPLKNKARPAFPRMTSAFDVVKYILIILFNSALVALLLGCVINAFGIDGVFSKTTLTIFWNNFDFGCILGLPLFSLVTLIRRERFSLNERLIVMFFLLAVLASLLAGALTWSEIHSPSGQTMDMWDEIYAYVAVTYNSLMLAEVIFLIFTERHFTVPVQKLSGLARNYVKSDGEALDSAKFTDACRLYENEKTEIGSLAESYAHMIKSLDGYVENIKTVTAEKERMAAELNIAAKIQADMLPREFPRRSEFDIYASMTPAKEVGGDFYDFFFVKGNLLALVIGDVSGKGVPAALFMVKAKTLINSRLQMGDSPARTLDIVNRQLCNNNGEQFFITVWIALVNTETGEGTAANAGHEHPALCRAGEKFNLEIYPHSPAVAAFDGIEFKEHRFRLAPGDSLFVYTDGVPEAENERQEFYGTGRMTDALNAEPDASPEKTLKNVKASVDSFAGKAPQFDDLTMMGFKYFGKGK